jgi:hypothetical protein
MREEKRSVRRHVQVVIQTQTLIVVRVHGDFGNERGRGEELDFDAVFGHDVVGACEAAEEQSGGGAGEGAHGGLVRERRGVVPVVHDMTPRELWRSTLGWVGMGAGRFVGWVAPK